MVACVLSGWLGGGGGQEAYGSLPAKTLAFFKAVSSEYAAEYVVKVDDDAYLRVWAIPQAVRQWQGFGAGVSPPHHPSLARQVWSHCRVKVWSHCLVNCRLTVVTRQLLSRCSNGRLSVIKAMVMEVRCRETFQLHRVMGMNRFLICYLF